MVTFGEVLRFDPEQIDEIFAVCTAQQRTCSTLDGHLKNLSDLDTWQGDAAQAAKAAAGKTRADLTAHGTEVWKVAAAARDCHNEAVELTASARRVQDDADSRGMAIDAETGTVTDRDPPLMRGWPDADKAAYYDEIHALQARVNDVIAAAERFDDDLAAAINAADGSIPLTPDGEGAHVNLADRRANQVAAYRSTYGTDPVTANDWRMAAVLDRHSYEQKDGGAMSNLKVGRFTPQPGRGLVTMNHFIARDQVFNFPDHDQGDHRSFDPESSPESNRATVYVDYERGLIVARQNPSVTVDGETRTGSPAVSASEGADGQINIKYNFANPFAPGGEGPAARAAESVRGAVSLTGGSANPTVNGTMSNYPSAEVYQYPTDAGSSRTIYRYSPGGPMSIVPDSEYGPLLNLPFTRSVGDPSLFPQLTSGRLSLDPYSSAAPRPVFLDQTPLGDQNSPTVIERTR